MAVGIIIGGAFATVVKSLVSDVLMPPLGLLIGKVDFSKMNVELKEGTPEVLGENGEVVTEAVPATTLNYGQFITELISFVILAFVVFIVIKKVMGSLKKEEEKAPAAPPKEQVLLEEIRDLLAKNQG